MYIYIERDIHIYVYIYIYTVSGHFENNYLFNCRARTFVLTVAPEIITKAMQKGPGICRSRRPS